MASLTELNAKIEELGRKRQEHDRRHNEGGYGYNPYAADHEQLVAEHSRLTREAEDAAFAAEWTLETFNACRAEWNAEMQKLPKTAKGIAWADIKALEGRLGYTMDDLKRAKAMLGVA